MNEPAARLPLYERLLRRLFPPLYRMLDEQQARQDRQRDELDADRGHAEQARRQLRESISALEAQAAAGRDAMARANETDREEARGRAEALAAALHDAHQRLEEMRTQFAAMQADGERRSGNLSAALEAQRGDQAAALAQMRGELAGQLQESSAGQMRGQTEQAAALAQMRGELTRQLQEISAELMRGQAEQAAGLAEARAAAAHEIAALRGELGAQLQQVRSELLAEQARMRESGEHLAADTAAVQAREERRLAALADRLHAIEAPADGLDYAAFEARFRGSEALIRERQIVYLPLLQAQAPIADLGCGRGELVAMLREAGLEAIGVENNESQLAACRANTLPVEGADLFAWLESRPAASLGAITFLQVIEHLTLAEQRRFLALAHRALRPKGMLLIETVNPHCAEAMEWFYIDPTHQRPVYPEMLDFLVQQAGFGRVNVRYQIPCTGAPPDQPPSAATGADFALWGYKP